MARVLAVGVYLADRPNAAAHLIYELAGSAKHTVVQRWIALAADGKGRAALPNTELVVTKPTPKFSLLNKVIQDAADFDWLVLCDDDVEVGPNFVDRLIDLSDHFDFALSQPARTTDSFTDHSIVQVLPGLLARRTRFVEIGPIVCIRRDAMALLLPFGEECQMGWGLDFIWPLKIEGAALRMGIVDAVPVAHRIRPPAVGYDSGDAQRTMSWALAAHPHLTRDEAFTVLEAYPCL